MKHIPNPLVQNNLLKKISIILVLLSSILFSQKISAQNSETDVIYPQMGRVSLFLAAGGTLGYTDYNSANIDLIWRGGMEYFFNTYSRHLFGLNLFFGTGSLNGNELDKRPTDFKTSLSFLGGGIKYGYMLGDSWFPTLFVGVSNLHFNPKDVHGEPLVNNKNGIYSKNAPNLNLEVGLNYQAPNRDIGIKLAFGTAYNFNDYLDDYKAGTQKDIFFVGYIGISYTINARKDDDKDGIENSRDICPDTPIGIAVDENGCPLDEDKDGVPDYLDKCPDTPTRAKADSNGCPVDTDADGVPDYIDKCPDTPKGAKVDRFGCAADTDYDGVPDYADECPGTPRNVKVDEKGCPIDTDGDGVPDYADRCADTPEGAVVDKTGCPQDSDGDGIPDYADKCPDTPFGDYVSRDGCSDNFSQYIFSSSSLFLPGESRLSPVSYDELNKVVLMIKSNPRSKWRIEGHTDNQGSPEDNKLLSLNRAQAVFDYFVSQNIKKNLFEVVGLGSDFPIGDNNTKFGRELNNRVVLIRLK